MFIDRFLSWFRKALPILFLVLLFPLSLLFGNGPSSEVTISLPRTGQTECFSGQPPWAVVACEDTGQDGDIRAGNPWPYERFLEGTGTASGCITDLLTGLMWTRSANLSGAAKPWQEALDYIAGVNSTGGICGYTDWRLPNINEIESLVNTDYTGQAPWLASRNFTDVQSNRYWSSTAGEPYIDDAWAVQMVNGSLSKDSIDASWYLWPVRGDGTGGTSLTWRTGQITTYYEGDDGALQQGIPWPSPRFAGPDGTIPAAGPLVLDLLTGLLWTADAMTSGPDQCTAGTTKTWQAALDHIACLNANTFLGHSDWRLPNRKEYLSLLDRSMYEPPLPQDHPFINVQSSYYWSSTSLAEKSPRIGTAWAVYMWTGEMQALRKTAGLWVWPVRGGEVVQSALLTVVKAGSGAGTVTSSPEGIDCGTACSARFDKGTEVTLAARASEGSVFTGWSGGGCAGADTCTIRTNGDVEVTAGFARNPMLTVTKSGNATGTVTSAPSGIDCGAACSATFPPGTVVTLTARAGDGSTFTGWSGGGCAGVGPCVLSLLTDTTVDAGFTACTYSVRPVAWPFAAHGGSVTTVVTAKGLEACPPPAIVGPSWIGPTLKEWKGNRGTVEVQASANADSSKARSGTVLVGGTAFAVGQAGAPCSLARLKPLHQYVARAGGNGSFTVEVSPPDCAWTAVTGAPWVLITSATGQGNGTVFYEVAANGGRSAREAVISVALHPRWKTTLFLVTQTIK
jgi:hypothetical protein